MKCTCGQWSHLPIYYCVTCVKHMTRMARLKQENTKESRKCKAPNSDFRNTKKVKR